MANEETWTRCDVMDRYVIKMAALGRHFQVGDLYNYRNDNIILPGIQIIDIDTSSC